MNCDELRACRIYDSLCHRLKADKTRHDEFILAMGAGQEVFEFDSGYGMRFKFLNRDGIWAVGYDMAELLAQLNGQEILTALRGMNEMCWSYLEAHMLSGQPGPMDPGALDRTPHESKL